MDNHGACGQLAGQDALADDDVVLADDPPEDPLDELAELDDESDFGVLDADDDSDFDGPEPDSDEPFDDGDEDDASALPPERLSVR